MTWLIDRNVLSVAASVQSLYIRQALVGVDTPMNFNTILLI